MLGCIIEVLIIGGIISLGKAAKEKLAKKAEKPVPQACWGAVG